MSVSRPRALSTVLLSMVIGLHAMAISKDPTTLSIGDPAPDFSLPAVDGKTYSLKDFAASKFLVLIFTCNHCPTAQAYEDRIIKLHADYKDRGVALVAINPNDALAVRPDELGYTDLGDSLDDMKIRAKDRNFKFPYLYDGETQKVSHAYGVLATPQVYIFDDQRKLRYIGRIDDSDVKEVTKHDTVDAIEALLAGNPVAVEKTRVFGCSTKWADKREDAKKWLAKADAEPVELKEIDEAAIKSLVKNDTQRLRLVNVWATWCGPCVAEMPELVTMNRMYRKRPFEMVTISLDQPDKKERALDQLKQVHASCTNYIFAGTDKDKFGDALDKEWPGPVPHTMLIAPGGKIIYRHTGEIDPLELKRAIVTYIGRTY